MNQEASYLLLYSPSESYYGLEEGEFVLKRKKGNLKVFFYVPVTIVVMDLDTGRGGA